MTLAEKVLEAASAFVGVRETSRNRGPEVDSWILAAAGYPLDLEKGNYAWCRAFVFGCFEQASRSLGLPNPVPRGLGVMKMWQEAQPYRKSTAPKPGFVFVISKGKGKGHTGFVEIVSPLHLVTIEGNTNDLGSREGDGVYRRTRRIEECVGFLDFVSPIPDLVA